MSYKEAEGESPFPYQALLHENKALLKQNQALKDEMQHLKARLEEAEELKRAISEGDLDALVLPGPENNLIFTLESADRAYRVLVETMNEGTATLGIDGTILYCNRRLAELLKMPLNTITGTSIYKFIAPEDEPTFQVLLEHEMASGEIKLQIVDGEPLPIYLSVSSLQVEGSPNAWCLVVTDLTEQKKNEELIASERLTRSIIEQSAEIIIVCDTSGRVTHFSKSILGIFGFVPTYNRFEDFIDLLYSEGPDAGKSILPVSSALKGFSILREEVTFELRDYKREFYLLLNSKPLKNSEGEIIGCVMTLSDITERKLAEKELKLAHEELQTQSEELLAQTEELRITNEELEESEKRFELLSEANALLLSSSEPEDVIRTIAEKVMRHLKCDVFFNYIFDEARGKLHLNAYSGISKEAAKEIEWLDKEDKTTICSCVARDGLRIVAKNLQLNNEQRADLVRSMLVQAYASQTLRIGEKTIGTLSFGTKNRKDFMEDELALMKTVADQLSVAIERKHVEEELAAAHSQIQSIIDNTPDIVYAFDSEERFVLANTAVAKVLNSTSDRMIGKRRHEFMPKEDADWHEANDRQVFEAGRALEFEEYSQLEDRSITWLTKKFPLHDAQGRIYAVAGISADITERKQAEEALRESEAKFRQIVETSMEGIWLINSNDQTIFVNEKISEMLGYSIKEITGQSPQKFMATEFSANAEDRLHENMQGAKQVMDYKFIRKDGSDLWCILSSSPLFDGKGKYAGSLAMITEITERKKAEKALKEAHDSLEDKVKERTVKLEEAYKSLSESERNLSEAQKMAHIGNWDLDIKTGDVYWSDETYRIFGLVPQEINLSYDQVLSYVHPSDRNYVINSIGKISNGKLEEIDYRILLANEEERVINTRLEVIFDEENNPAKLRGTVQDITERNKAEIALDKINKIRIKEIHHRIKNNLQVISSMLDLQSEKFRSNKVLEAFRESQNRVFSMALIHEELYKGDETDKLNFSVYIEKLAEKLFQTYSVSSKIHLKMDLEENAFMDMDTAIPLGIIVNELISNSLKHAFNKSEEGEILVQLSKGDKAEKNNETPESVFYLTIADDGKGIPEDLELENVESLGLQLVVILVDQLDGEIELIRAQGTEFRITFNVKEK